MLEGLEITEIWLSKVVSGTPTHRFDPEYFQKQHIADETVIELRKSEFSSFSGLGLTVDASAFYPSIESYYGEGTLPFLRVGDVDSIIDFEGCTRIPEHLCTLYPTLAKVRPGDILLTKGGSVARVGLVTQLAAASRDLIFLNSSKLAREEQIFVYLYAQTGFFNRALLRSSSQTAQPHLTITLVRDLRVLNASHVFKTRLLGLVDEAFNARDQAIASRVKAEEMLLVALGLDDWKSPDPLSYIRSSQDAFATGRLDAEFFTPRVRDMLARLGRDGLTIRDVAPARKERFAPDDSGDFHYIEIGGLSADGTAQAECLSQREAPSRATQYVRTGDVITSTVRPIRRLSAVIDTSQDGYVCSSGFVVLQPHAISSDVLLTYLRLPPVCALMDLHTSASMYPAISEADLLTLPIPEIPAATQRTIEKSVQAARQAKQRATQLLDTAKRAVEIAIEHDEKLALAYLESRA